MTICLAATAYNKSSTQTHTHTHTKLDYIGGCMLLLQLLLALYAHLLVAKMCNLRLDNCNKRTIGLKSTKVQENLASVICAKNEFVA